RHHPLSRIARAQVGKTLKHSSTTSRATLSFFDKQRHVAQEARSDRNLGSGGSTSSAPNQIIAGLRSPLLQARKSACRIMEHLSRVEQQGFHLPVDGEGDPLCP
ncbi:hypothetical protein, partial [Bradyrhizobium elkanii]|uniref:hypothetical protein n=1 Tax=Bradyrhizobium elkanii TaxID=29448 RepID=UPI001AEBD0B9